MAMETEAKIAALLAVLLLAHTLLLQLPRLRGPAAATTLITDILLSTLDLQFDGRRLVDLITRRNVILLCHAILLIILRDAGLLATPARRCAAATSSSTASASAPAGGGASSHHQPHERSIVVWRNKPAKNATIADGGRLKSERRGPRPAKVTARRRALPLTEAAATEREEAVVQELALVEERSYGCCLDDADHVFVREIVAVEDKSSCLSFVDHHIDDHEGSNGGEDGVPREETEAECGDDVDEMNKMFEEFIANTKRKMQLESLQLVKV